MKHESLIQQIEKAKETLTQAQKDLEDDNLQGAGDCLFAAKCYIQPAHEKISELFNKYK